MAEVREQLQQQIEELKAAISKLCDRVEAQELAGGLTRSPSVPDTKNSDFNDEKPVRESGYVNWDESHNSLKNMAWISCDLFRNRILNLQYQSHFDWPAVITNDRKCKIINENTRFPEDRTLPIYVNISDPKIQYVIRYCSSIINKDNKEDHYKLVTLLENHLYTRSSFEEKYNLIWVDPKKQNS